MLKYLRKKVLLMRILTIYATPHKGNTRAITEIFLNNFKNENNEFDEIVLPMDMPHLCLGCGNCIVKGEEYCPHHKAMEPVLDRIEKADLLVFATPCFVNSCSSGLKALLDHLGYIFMVHRPKASMFHKVAMIITTAAGAGIKSTRKLIQFNLFYWGVPKVFNYGITCMKMGGNYSETKKKDKIIKAVNKKAKKVKKALKNPKPGFKTRLFFNIFKFTQKNPWNPVDGNYWKESGWLDGKKPY